MATTHVFVCYSALSYDAAKRISSELAPGDPTVVLTLFSAPADSGRYFSRVFSLVVRGGGVAEIYKPFIIARWFRGVLNDLAEETSFTAYIPHPFELPANHFAYSEPRVRRLELLPDGLLNYTAQGFYPSQKDARLRLRARALLREAAAAANSMKYVPLNQSGHLTQFETLPYERTWTDNRAGFLTSRKNLSVLPHRRGPEMKKQAQVDALILDQELAPLVNHTTDKLLRTALIQALHDSQVRTLLYKAHPRGKNRAEDFKSAGFEVSDVTGSDLAEEIITRHEVSRLFGFYSTPLLLSAHEVHERYCVLPEPSRRGVKNPAQVREYVAAFKNSGARVSLI